MMLKQIWMSPETKRKSRYGLRTLGGILGIAALVLVLIGGGTVLGFAMGWPVEVFSVILCVGYKAENSLYEELIITNYDPRKWTHAGQQFTLFPFGDEEEDERNYQLIHEPDVA